MLHNESGTPAAFLDAAVEFANESCWGALSCTILIHPKTKMQLKDQWEESLAALRYGNIVVNAPAKMGFATTTMTWGGFPGEQG